jgi:hypothetical protein
MSPVLDQEVYMSGEVFSAMQILKTDPEAAKVFEELSRSSGNNSGWDLSRKLGLQPEILVKTLDQLKEVRLVGSSGEGLAGIYYLTDLGYRLRLNAA